jgi:hypothetical protein
MMKSFCCMLLGLVYLSMALGQQKREDIYSDFVLYPKRVSLEKDLRERVIAKNFSLVLDSNTEYKFATACDAVSQFLFMNDDVKIGFNKLFSYYDSLEPYAKKSFLEAVYASYPTRYKKQMEILLSKETDPKLFSLCAVYLFRNDSSVNNANFLKIKMVEKFPGYDSLAILSELQKYLSNQPKQVHTKPPNITELFRYQKSLGLKTIYSFQRYNRDYPGLAIVQTANGNFVKDGNGRLLVFEQLARASSNLPYFVPNGNTPQGIYSIQGTAISRTHFIGPTPNLQLLMPFENKWEKYFKTGWANGQDSLLLYKNLLPAEWRNYEPMMEAWNAGNIGRSFIIAHGTTIDPEYYRGKPFYPLTPSQGCLTAKELWNVTTGKLLVSEQFNLVSAFQSANGKNGYLFVINLDNQQKAVSRNEMEALVKRFEMGN